MPDLLSLPRELRDDIYEIVFRSSLTLKKARIPRIRISRRKTLLSEPADEVIGTDDHEHVARGVSGIPGVSNQPQTQNLTYYEGEEAIRYPVAEPVPPTDPLLHVTQQIRAEMQETIQKKSINWRIRLAFRDDKELLYPTWMSMPAFKDRIDNLDVEIRVRKKKTASLFSTASSIASTDSNVEPNYGRPKTEGDVFFGGFALLQRLLERGPCFVNKKWLVDSAATPMTIGCLTMHLLPKDLEYQREPQELLGECVNWVDQLLTDKDDSDHRRHERDEEWYRIDAFLHFFASRIEKFAFEVEGLRNEWVMEDAMAERDERTRLREEREERARVEMMTREQEEGLESDEEREVMRPRQQTVHDAMTHGRPRPSEREMVYDSDFGCVLRL